MFQFLSSSRVVECCNLKRESVVSHADFVSFAHTHIPPCVLQRTRNLFLRRITSWIFQSDCRSQLRASNYRIGDLKSFFGTMDAHGANGKRGR